jgi:hypothetical protein
MGTEGAEGHALHGYCGKQPSESTCSLTIAGERDEVIRMGMEREPALA